MKETLFSSEHSLSVSIDRIKIAAYKIPTDQPESDGTLEWNSTTLVLVHLQSEDHEGVGFTYCDASAAHLIENILVPVLQKINDADIPQIWSQMTAAVRNVGHAGIAACGISAVDIAMWDLKAKMLSLPLVNLLGKARSSVEIYGSGGFTSYSIDQLRNQVFEWARSGIRQVKIKVGRQPELDPKRVKAARDAIGVTNELFVDANGAYNRKQALKLAEEFSESGVTWFEEPVSSDDLEGLRFIRNHAPPGMNVAAGEYGYDAIYFRRMLEAGAVDVLQADATRCGGITGFLQADALAYANSIPFSAHTAPSIHLHACCAARSIKNLEYFHDHVRIEQLLFEGVTQPIKGVLSPSSDQPGLGIELRESDAEPFKIYKKEIQFS